MSRNLSTAEVSRVLGMKQARIREWVRSGLCRPARRGRRYAFSFQDLVLLRAARGLLEKGIPKKRVRRALAALGREIPKDRPLSGLRVYADGGEVAVRSSGTSWQPATGQVLLDFGMDDLAERVEQVRKAAVPLADAPAAQARAEFQRALDCQDDDPGEARSAYARALSLDPELTDAYVNLGRLVHDAGDPRDATRLYHLALQRSPEDPIVHFNLALALEDASGAEAAARHYERALALAPDFADAHYNLAGVCEQLGRRADAIRHYSAYRSLEGE